MHSSSNSMAARANYLRVAAAAILAAALFAARPAESQELAANSFVGGPSSTKSGDSISDLARRGKHFEAMVQVYEEKDQMTLSDRLGAAKSAWALGLVDRAREYWDEALNNPEFKEDERYRTMLARSIVELQEGGFEQARAIAERAAAKLDSSELRAQFWLVIAEALKEQKALSLAEEYYNKAIKDGEATVQTEARFLLGECELKLGRLNEARYAFASVDAGSSYTLQALHRLIEIDFGQRNYEGVLTWVNEGRESYPTEFRDGWTTYATVSSLVELTRTEDARKELQDFKVRRSDQDSWFPLAEAAIEARSVRAMFHSVDTEESEK